MTDDRRIKKFKSDGTPVYEDDAPPKQPSWIARHLTGYMFIVYILDLALVALLFTYENLEIPVRNFSTVLIDALIVLNIIPPLMMFTRRVARQCSGPYWPVKVAVMIAVAGGLAYISAWMTEQYAVGIDYRVDRDHYSWHDTEPDPAVSAIYKTGNIVGGFGFVFLVGGIIGTAALSLGIGYVRGDIEFE